MNIFLIGPSGAGKGVQAKLLVEKFGLDYIVMSDLLKKSWETRPDIKEMMQSGVLVPPEVTFDLLKEKFGNFAPANTLLDGYPRTIDQYELMKTWFKEVGGSFDLAILLTVSDEALVNRLSARRLDPESGKIYNLITDAPPSDVDQSKLVQRDDDKPEAIKKRLAWFKDSVMPMVKYIKDEGVVKVAEIDGDRPIDVIHNELSDIIEELINEG
jgi:adenylate kinase